MGGEKRYPRISNANDDSSHNLIGPNKDGGSGLRKYPEDIVKPLASLGSTYSSHFEPNKQTWALFKGQALRLIFTIILVILYVASLKIYQDEGNIRHQNKEVFNTVTTVLSLALGLNFLVCDCQILPNRALCIMTLSDGSWKPRKRLKTWPKF